MQVRKSTVNEMIKAMEETLQEDLSVIKGMYQGLNEFKEKIIQITNSVKQNETIDIKQFFFIDAELKKKVNQIGSPLTNETASFKSGYLYGLERGRQYIDTLYYREAKYNDEITRNHTGQKMTIPEMKTRHRR